MLLFGLGIIKKNLGMLTAEGLCLTRFSKSSKVKK